MMQLCRITCILGIERSESLLPSLFFNFRNDFCTKKRTREHDFLRRSLEHFLLRNSEKWGCRDAWDTFLILLRIDEKSFVLLLQ